MKSTFDEALECLRGAGSEVAGGVAPNHGPMAAEALVALGRDDDVVAWARRYRRRLDTMPSPGSPISAEGWPQVLGATDRFADWVAFFREQMAEAPWRAVFREWIARLLPATPSAGGHGLPFALRTLFARCRTPRLCRASKSSELPWYTGLPTTVSSLAPRTSWVRSILARRSFASHSSSAERHDRACPGRFTSG